MSCGEGHQFRTRDVAKQAENGGSQCVGKKYSIGGKVRPDLTGVLTGVLTDPPCPLVFPRLLPHGLPVVGLELGALLLLLLRGRHQAGSQRGGLAAQLWGPAL